MKHLRIRAAVIGTLVLALTASGCTSAEVTRNAAQPDSEPSLAAGIEAAQAKDESDAAREAVRQQSEEARKQRKELTDASARAKQSNGPVTVDSLTTQTSQVFAQANGEFTMEATASPTRVFRDRAWQELNPALKVDGSQLFPTVAGNSVTIANGVDAGGQLARVATTPEVIAQAAQAWKGDSVDTNELVASSQAPEDPSLAVSWPQALPEPAVAENTARFANAHQTAALEVSANPGGFLSTLIWEQRPAEPVAPVQFNVTTTGGLQLEEVKGTIRLLDSQGNPVSTTGILYVQSTAEQSAQIKPAVNKVDDNTWTVTLTMTQEFFRDTKTVYPLTAAVSPPFETNKNAYVESNKKSLMNNEDLKIGRLQGYPDNPKAQSYVKFAIGRQPELVVTSAKVSVYQTHSGVCKASPLQTRKIKEAWGPAQNTSWSKRPALGPVMAQKNSNFGGPESSCSSFGQVEVRIDDALAQEWYDNPAANFGVALTAPTDEAVNTWKRVCSSRACIKRTLLPKLEPKLTVSATLPEPPVPTAPTKLSVSDVVEGKVGSTTPQLNAVFHGDMSVPLVGVFEVYDTGKPGSPAIWQDGIETFTGEPLSTTVDPGVLSNHGSYQFKAFGSNPSGDGPRADGPTFVIDTDPPLPVAVSCSYVANGGYNTAPAPAALDFTLAGAPDVVKFEISTGEPVPAAVVDRVGTSQTWRWVNPGNGWHVLTVVAIDKVGNRAPAAVYEFGLGPAHLTAPGIQSRTAGFVPVGAIINTPPATNGLSAQVWWRVGNQPAAQVTEGLLVDGKAWDGSVAVEGPVSRIPDALVWDVGATQATRRPGTELLAAPSVINVSVRFVNGGQTIGTTDEHAVQRVQHAFGGNFATAAAGPGQVSLLTGELQVATTDTSLPGNGGISSGRTWLSLTGPGSTGVFGPGWQADIPSPSAGALSATVVDRSAIDGSIVLTYSDGSADTFGWDKDSSTYKPTGLSAQAGGFIAVSGTSMTLTDTDGSVTTWTKQAEEWKPQSVTTPLAQGSAGYISTAASDAGPGYQAVITGRYLEGGKPVNCSNLANAPDAMAAVNAAAAKPGCRSLTLTISPTNQPKPTDDPGGYPGQVAAATIRLWDNSGVIGHPFQQETSRWEYNSDGLLVSQWNPQLDGPDGSLKTRYTYTKDDLLGWMLQSVTPASAGPADEPALAPWTFGYDENLGRLTQASRPAPNGDTATTFVTYGVAMTGDDLPKMTMADVATWDQPAYGAPSRAVAVFYPDPQRPGSLDPDSPSGSDWLFADITYLNALGAPVNTAAFGAGDWQIDTIEYNHRGEVVQSLSAGNRAVALGREKQSISIPASVSALPTSAEKAAALSSYTFYDPKLPGVVTDTFSPVVGDSRSYVHTDYNTGAPSDVVNSGAALPTKQTTTWTAPVVVPSPATPPAKGAESRITLSSYDPVIGGSSGWTLRQPTQTQVVMGAAPDESKDIITRSAYNASGQVTESRMPQAYAIGDGPGVTINAFYSAGSNPGPNGIDCGGKPAWENLPCVSTPKGQPPGNKVPMSVSRSYNALLLPLVADDIPPGTALVRTTTTTYDKAGRVTSAHVTGGTPQDAPLPKQEMAYSASTSLPISTRTVNDDGSQIGIVSQTYDSWGQVVSYTDANGTTSTTSYNIAGQPERSNDGKGETEYVYDNSDPKAGPIEHRGLITAQRTEIGDGIAGTWLLTYMANGKPFVVAGPSQLINNFQYDTLGRTNIKNDIHIRSDETADVLGLQMLSYDEFGQTRGDIELISTAPDYGQVAVFDYDKAGRLTSETSWSLALHSNQDQDLRLSWNQIDNYTKDSIRAASTNRAFALKNGSCPVSNTATPGCPPLPQAEQFPTPEQVAATHKWLKDPANAASIAKTVRSTNYNAADQLVNTIATTTPVGQPQTSMEGRYDYDPFARTTRLPAVDTTTPQADVHASFSYYVNDLAHTQTRGDTTQTFTLDPVQRFAGSLITTGGVTSDNQVNHYSDATDSPAWTYTTDTNTWQRYISGPAGALAITATGTGNNTTADSSDINFVNLHGDIYATAPNTPNMSPSHTGTAYSAFGIPQTVGTTPAPAPQPYGWEGAAQRSNHAQTGLIMMGVRQYNPATGNFLTQDPIPGGNANPYTYPTDPVGGEDLDGEASNTSKITNSCLRSGNPRKIASCLRIANWVNSYADSAGRNDNDRNAMRHVMFSMLLSWSIGQNDALNVLNENELTADDYSDAAADNLNNGIGVRNARRLRKKAAQHGGALNDWRIAKAKQVYDRKRIKGQVWCPRTYKGFSPYQCTADSPRKSR